MYITRRSHIPLLLGVTVTWLFFTSMYLPTKKQYYYVPSEELQHFEEAIEEMERVSFKESHQNNIQTVSSNKLPVVVFITTSIPNRHTPLPAVFESSVTMTKDYRRGEDEYKQRRTLYFFTYSNSTNTIGDTSSHQNMSLTNTSNEQNTSNTHGNTHGNNEMSVRILENIETAENDAQYLEDADRSRNPDNDNYYVEDEEELARQLEEREQYLANYKKFYPRYKKPIDERYLQTIRKK